MGTNKQLALAGMSFIIVGGVAFLATALAEAYFPSFLACILIALGGTVFMAAIS